MRVIVNPKYAHLQKEILSQYPCEKAFGGRKHDYSAGGKKFLF